MPNAMNPLSLDEAVAALAAQGQCAPRVATRAEFYRTARLLLRQARDPRITGDAVRAYVRGARVLARFARKHLERSDA